MTATTERMKNAWVVIIFLVVLGSVPATVVGSPKPGKVVVSYSSAVRNILSKHLGYTVRQKTIPGYRIRVYRDNKAQARAEAKVIIDSLNSHYPGVPSYLAYDNPYFKVTMGDFRTKDEALKLFLIVQKEFPRAFIVAEAINLPPLYREEPSNEVPMEEPDPMAGI